MRKYSVLPVNQEMVNQAIASLSAPSKLTIEQKREALFNALKDRSVMQEYAMQRVPVINLYLKARTIGTDFFETQTLRGSEIPMYLSQGAKPRIPITVMSDWGGFAQRIYTDTQGIVQFGLGYVASEVIKTPKISLVQGRIDKSAEVNEQIAVSLGDKLDDMAWAVLNTAFGAFNTDVMQLDPKLKNIPTTNDLDFSTTCSGKITKDFYKGIVDHFARLGLNIRKVYVPAVRLGDHLDWVSVSGGQTDDVLAKDTIPASVQEKIWQTGGLNLGASWIPEIQPSNVLEGEEAKSIYCYVVTDKPVGYGFEKPEIDIVKTDDNDPMFYESYMTKAIAYAVPAPNRKNVARVLIG